MEETTLSYPEEEAWLETWHLPDPLQYLDPGKK